MVQVIQTFYTRQLLIYLTHVQVNVYVQFHKISFHRQLSSAYVMRGSP